MKTDTLLGRLFNRKKASSPQSDMTNTILYLCQRMGPGHADWDASIQRIAFSMHTCLGYQEAVMVIEKLLLGQAVISGGSGGQLSPGITSSVSSRSLNALGSPACVGIGQEVVPEVAQENSTHVAPDTTRDVCSNTIIMMSDVYNLHGGGLFKKALLKRKLPLKLVHNKSISPDNRIRLMVLTLEWFESLYHPILINELKRELAHLQAVAEKARIKQMHKSTLSLESAQQGVTLFMESMTYCLQLQPHLSLEAQQEYIQSKQHLDTLHKQCLKVQTKVTKIIQRITDREIQDKLLDVYSSLLNQLESAFVLYDQSFRHSPIDHMVQDGRTAHMDSDEDSDAVTL